MLRYVFMEEVVGHAVHPNHCDTVAEILVIWVVTDQCGVDVAFAVRIRTQGQIRGHKSWAQDVISPLQG